MLSEGISSMTVVGDHELEVCAAMCVLALVANTDRDGKRVTKKQRDSREQDHWAI